jgi:hypothetical protein
MWNVPQRPWNITEIPQKTWPAGTKLVATIVLAGMESAAHIMRLSWEIGMELFLAILLVGTLTE